MPTKLQFLLRPPPGTSHEALTDALFGAIVPRALTQGPTGLKVTWTARPRPLLHVIPLSRRPVALISVWGGLDPADLAPGWTVHGWRVEEAIPKGYDRHWPDGEDTPGVGLLTSLRRKPGLSDHDLRYHWHEVHSASTLQIHPIWNYVRNQVLEGVVPGSPERDGLVEEHVREPRELLHPLGFFGGYARALPTMIRTGLETRRFIHFPSMESWLVAERWIRTPAG